MKTLGCIWLLVACSSTADLSNTSAGIDEYSPLVNNDDVDWDGTFIGLMVRLHGTTRFAAETTSDEDIPKLIAMERPAQVCSGPCHSH